MRPILIRMQAFGPFAGTQEIDFRELGDNRFFLIHGPTGSGKTTVLDAMCYALYGATTGAERTAEQMRSQYADAGMPTEVVFDFRIGDDGYRVRRAPKQERPKARGQGTTIAQTEATLWRRPAGLDDADDGQVLETKVGAVDAAIERIVGFRADQFRQVVMIPQGRFRDLLSASSGDREKIMQTLFSTGMYAAIEIRLREQRKQIDEALAGVAARRDELLGGAGVASEAELSDAVKTCETACAEAIGLADEAKVASAEAAVALEVARAAASSVQAVEVAKASLVEADRARAEAETSAESARAAMESEEARQTERAAAADRVRELEAIEQACRDLDAATRSSVEAGRAREAAAEVLADAQDSLGRLRVELANARERSAAGSGAAAEAVRAEATVEAARTALRDVRAAARMDADVTMATGERDASAAASADALLVSQETATDRDGLLLRWREGRAALLAADLRSGDPCPVCGSTEHPAPARADSAPPTDDELAAAEQRVRDAADAATRAARRAADAAAALSAAEATRAALKVPDGLTEQLAAAALESAERDRAAATLRAREAEAASELVRTLAAEEAGLVERVAAAQVSLSALDRDAAVAAGKLSIAEDNVPPDLRSPGALDAALGEAREAQSRLESALRQARAASADASVALAGADARRSERAAALDAATESAAGIVVPDIAALEVACDEAARQRDAAIAASARARGELEARQSVQERLDELAAQNGELLERHRVVAAISDAANGRNARNLSFQRYVLGVFLTDVLAAATKRLEIMTRGRYRLHLAPAVKGRGASGLDLEVFDEYTGEDRPVGTLSGGEGFLASLALALGLAEVVESFAGGVHLDTVFVDEGFGTLDEEALETAIDALMELQGRSRLVGIISHVTELQKVIPARLEVTASPSGSSARFVVP